MDTHPPTYSLQQRLFLLCSLVAALFITVPLSAQSIDTRLSTNRAYVGMPVYLQITVSNSQLDHVPELPPIDGVAVKALGAQNRSSQVVIINGQRTESSQVSYIYALTPERPGQYVIPPFDITVNGQKTKTHTMSFVARESVNDGDLYVSIKLDSEIGYVGEAIDVILQIDIKPYIDEQLGVTLGPSDMWRQVDFTASQWGAFEDSIQSMLNQRQGPSVSQIVRENEQGTKERYYRYEVPGTFLPKRAGQLDVSDVRVVLRYPTGLRQATGFFSRPGEVQLAGIRPVIAAANVDPVEVRPIPTNGRPAWFTGSVGQFWIAADAQPTHVHVGDPIQLLLRVRGTGEMDFLHAPPLWKVPELTQNFDVPREPVPGIVRGENKIFSMTVRPKNEHVTEIPALPFSYFNPESETFETVWTEPIAVSVKPVTRLALDQIVSATAPAVSSSEDDEAASPALIGTNIARGPDVMSSSSADAAAQHWLLWLLGIPVVSVMVIVIIEVLRSGSLGGLLNVQSLAYRRVQCSMASADDVATLRTAIQAYCDALPDHKRVAICHLESDFLTACDHAAYAGNPKVDLQLLKARAQKLVETAREAQPAPDSASMRRPAVGKTLGSLGIVFALFMTTSAFSQNVSLSPEQQMEILMEAEKAFDQGLAMRDDRPDAATAAFKTASERYKLLLDSGVNRASLNRNLGLAYLQAGEPAYAKAYLLRAKSQIGTDAELREALHLADRMLADSEVSPVMEAGSAPLTFVDQIRDLNSIVSMQGRVNAAAFAWASAWLIVTIMIVFRKKLTRPVIRVGTFAIASCLAITVTAASSVAWTWYDIDNEMRAVAVAENATLQRGVGQSADLMTSTVVTSGDELSVLDQRDGWVKVQTSGAAKGWLRMDDVVVIEPPRSSRTF